jgi:hypothetical protein
VIAEVGSSGQITIYNYSGSVNFTVDVAGYYTDGSNPNQTGSLFSPVITPARIVDTRCGSSPQPSYCSSENIPHANSSLSAVGAGRAIAAQVVGEAGIPSNATAFVGNVTVTGGTGSGYLVLYSSSNAPRTSDVNFSADATDANMVISQLNSSGQVNIKNGGARGSVDVLVDVSGWFTSVAS